MYDRVSRAIKKNDDERKKEKYSHDEYYKNKVEHFYKYKKIYTILHISTYFVNVDRGVSIRVVQPRAEIRPRILSTKNCFNILPLISRLCDRVFALVPVPDNCSLRSISSFSFYATEPISLSRTAGVSLVFKGRITFSLLLVHRLVSVRQRPSNYSQYTAIVTSSFFSKMKLNRKKNAVQRVTGDFCFAHAVCRVQAPPPDPLPIY